MTSAASAAGAMFYASLRSRARACVCVSCRGRDGGCSISSTTRSLSLSVSLQVSLYSYMSFRTRVLRLAIYLFVFTFFFIYSLCRTLKLLFFSQIAAAKSSATAYHHQPPPPPQTPQQIVVMPPPPTMQPASPLPPAPSTQATQTSQVVQVNGGQSLTADNTANNIMTPVTKRSPKDYIFGKVIGEGSYSTVRIHIFYMYALHIINYIIYLCIFNRTRRTMLICYHIIYILYNMHFLCLPFIPTKFRPRTTSSQSSLSVRA